MTLTYNEYDIEECIDLLTWKAKEIGEAHNLGMAAYREREGRVWQGAPNAYRATNSWHAVEIIRQLQAELKKLQNNQGFDIDHAIRDQSSRLKNSEKPE